jgi:DNA-binding winged helix-turn-helix (wHTH) protein
MSHGGSSGVPGAIVYTEPQVFDLLVHLIRNRERIVCKDELIDAIWQGRIVSAATHASGELPSGHEYR